MTFHIKPDQLRLSSARRNAQTLNQSSLSNFFRALILLTLTFSADAAELYVSTSGSDSISYSDVSIQSPWKTLNHAIYNLKEGDTLFIRGGRYTPKYTLFTKDDYTSKSRGGNPNETMNAESGLANKKVYIVGYPGEQIIIDLSQVRTFINLDNINYWVFEDLNFVNAGSAFIIGEDRPSIGNEFRRLTIQSRIGGDNSASIKLIGANAEKTTIENCVIEGPGNSSDVHLNTAGIFARRVNNLTIRNNEISNSPFGIYFKHANSPKNANYSDVNILIENNFFFSTSRSALETNSNGAVVANNVFGPSSSGIRNNEANGTPGGDGNSYIHNTFVSGSLNLTDDTQTGDDKPGSIGNTVIGNLFTDTIQIHRYSASPHNTNLRSNLYPSNTSHVSNRIEYTLERWQNSTGLDAGSETGTPDFVGGEAYNPPSYALLPSSPGKSINDGQDAGADVSKVGANIDGVTAVSSSSRPTPPEEFRPMQ